MAPGVTAETDMKQTVMEEAAQVNTKYAVTLRPRYQDLPAALWCSCACAPAVGSLKLLEGKRLQPDWRRWGVFPLLSQACRSFV